MTVAGVTACGQNASQNAVTYNEAYLDSVADFLIANWAGMSESEIASISELDADDAQALIDANGLPFEADAFTTGFSAYAGVAEDLGAYVDTVEYSTPVVSGDEITLDVEVQYEHRTADISLVFDADSIVQSVDVSPHYTMGEILYKAVMNTIIGMGTVFLVLIFISLVIYCFKFIPAIQKKFSRKEITALIYFMGAWQAIRVLWFPTIKEKRRIREIMEGRNMSNKFNPDIPCGRELPGERRSREIEEEFCDASDNWEESGAVEDMMSYSDELPSRKMFGRRGNG